MNASVVTRAGERGKIISVICVGHFYSHFSNLVLPPLFSFIKADTGIEYLSLGALVAAPAFATGASQVPFGFLVDRFGGRPVLILGIAMMGLGFALVGFATEFWQLLALMTLVGLGNGVFHPADYSILTSRIADGFIGRAVSMHSFSGYIGWAAAPAIMLGLSQLMGWRMAVSVIGLAGLAIVCVVLVFGSSLKTPTAPVTKDERPDAPSAARQGLTLMTSPAMLMLLAFFLLTAITTGGVASFAVVVTMELYGADEALANSVLTAYLVAMALGVLAGGVIADRIGRLNQVATVAVGVFAAMIAVYALGVFPLPVVVAALALGGFGFGVATPSRDLLVRAAAPPGTIGVAFGFTSTGLGVGGAIGPIICGWIMDTGRPGWAFALLAATAAVSMIAIVMTRIHTVPRES